MGSPRPHFNIYPILSTYARVYISLLRLCNPPTTTTVCSLASAMYSYHVIVRLCNIHIVRQGGPQPIYTTEVLTYLPYIEAMDRLYCTIYNILYSECATEQTFHSNIKIRLLPRRWHLHSASACLTSLQQATVPFAFSRRLHDCNRMTIGKYTIWQQI